MITWRTDRAFSSLTRSAASACCRSRICACNSERSHASSDSATDAIGSSSRGLDIV